MRKRWLAIGLTAVMMTGMVGASAQAAEKSTDTDEQVTLELFWQKSNTNVIQEIIDKFEAENPNIKIELTATSSDTGKQIFQTRMATNEPMDLVQHWPSQAVQS